MILEALHSLIHRYIIPHCIESHNLVVLVLIDSLFTDRAYNSSIHVLSIDYLPSFAVLIFNLLSTLPPH